MSHVCLSRWLDIPALRIFRGFWLRRLFFFFFFYAMLMIYMSIFRPGPTIFFHSFQCCTTFICSDASLLSILTHSWASLDGYKDFTWCELFLLFIIGFGRLLSTALFHCYWLFGSTEVILNGLKQPESHLLSCECLNPNRIVWLSNR